MYESCQRFFGWSGLLLVGNGVGLATFLLTAFCGVLAGCKAVPEAPAPPIFYPAPPVRPRVQFLCGLSSAADVAPARNFFARLVFGEEREREADRIVRPYGMAMTPDVLYVCDSGGRRIVAFDFERREFRTFGDTGEPRLGMPIHIAVGPNGEKFVSDASGGQVLVLDARDRVIRRMIARDGMRPCDAVLLNRELYVVDARTNTIRVFDPDSGGLLRQLGRPGSALGEFFKPTNLAVGPGGNLYVSDTLNARVQRLDGDGQALQAIGSLGTALGQMVRPKGIAVDREGRLYVADAATDSVQIYNPEGTLLMRIGGPGPDPGDMALPAGVSVSYEGLEHFAKYVSPDFKAAYLVFVSNHLGPHKVNVYAFGAYVGALPGEGAGSPRPPERNGTESK